MIKNLGLIIDVTLVLITGLVDAEIFFGLN